MDTTLFLDKIIILYILHSLDAPISNGQLEELILSKNYSNYFDLTLNINSLVSDDLIEKSTFGNRTEYILTKKGDEIYNMFRTHLSRELKNEIQQYLCDNAFRLKEELSINSEIITKGYESYEFHGIIKEDNSPLIDISLNFPSKELAEKANNKWKTDASLIYSKIIESFND